MVTTEELELVRHIVHKILIPCIFAVGVVGNTLSIIVLTRKRMRCSTNVYLTGLAITDLLYLVMCFIMSLKHYKGMHSYKMYWSLMGLFHWLIDSFSYISICIVVSFTIERYIAVCHPIRGQSLCTEARAKKVIGIITVVVMLSILSTAFEYQLHHELQPVNRATGELCKITNNTAEKIVDPAHNNDGFYRVGHVVQKHRRDSHVPKKQPIISRVTKDKGLSVDYDKLNVRNESDCVLVDYYIYESSELGKNPNYSIFYITTSIVYAGIPLILLITFNTFLIMAVRKSNKLRKDMTNNINSRQVKQKISSMTQENKITITLIAVVILFVVCQLPWACISIAENFTEFDDNFEKLISNIANLLVAINAAANFFLYCLLSDKYRRTVKELITGHHYRRQKLNKSTKSDDEGLMRRTKRQKRKDSTNSDEEEDEEGKVPERVNHC